MSKIIEKKNKTFISKNRFGKPNGFLVPILNIHEDFINEEQWPQQAYLTVANVGEVKGPHLHKKRWQLYTCIKGNVKIVVRIDDKYEEYFSGENYAYKTVQVPAGIPSALVNIGDEDAFVLNMPSPAWHEDDVDDWEVKFDDYDFKT